MKQTPYLASIKQTAEAVFNVPSTHPKGGIYMTLHLKPNLAYDKLPSYTLLVAGAVYKAIKNLTLIDVDIKWVNDIYLNNHKIGGILIEAMTSCRNRPSHRYHYWSRINFTIKDFPSGIKRKAASLFKAPAPITRNELIIEIWRAFFEKTTKRPTNPHKKTVLRSRKRSYFYTR